MTLEVNLQLHFVLLKQIACGECFNCIYSRKVFHLLTKFVSKSKRLLDISLDVSDSGSSHAMA